MEIVILPHHFTIDMKIQFPLGVCTIVLMLFLTGCLGHDRIQNVDEKVELSDFISISLVAKSQQGVVLEHTNGFDNRPKLMYCVRPYFVGDFNSSLVGLKKGRDTTFRISVDSLSKYTYSPTFKNFKSGDFIDYKVRVNEIVKRSGKSDSLFNAAVEELKRKDTELAKQTEANKIKQYIAVNPHQHRMMNENIYYNYLVEGAGDLPKKNSRVKVYYSFATLDGQIFETNIVEKAISSGIYNKNLPYLAIDLKVPVLPKSGFEILLSKMKLNTEISAVLPSKYAYGAGGNRFLPAYAPVVIYLRRVQ